MVQFKKQNKYPANNLNHYAQLELMNFIKPGAERILDLGCGDGKTTEVIADLYPKAEVIGLTANEKEVQNSKSSIKIIFGDAHNLPWTKSSFDVVFARHILEHCIAPLVVLQEINRILKMGGQAIICVPGIEKEWLLKMEDHYSVLPPKLWEKLFIDCGFNITRSEQGTWLAYYSMESEVEYRYVLEKINEVGTLNVLKQVYSPKDYSYVEPAQTWTQNPIAFVMHNLVVYETLKPILDELDNIDTGYDIIIPCVSDSSSQGMFDDTAKAITKLGYRVRRIDKDTVDRYKVAFFPFLPFYYNVKADYIVRYQYGMAKPTYNYDLWSINFDFIMCMSPYDQMFLKAYSQAILAGPVKYAGFVKTPYKAEKTRSILYLPTYGELSSIEKVTGQLKLLIGIYDIKVKLHHMTSYFEQERVELVNADLYGIEVYDHRTPLTNILSNTDIIITDGSGAIFDAIIAGIPVITINAEEIPAFENEIPLEHRLSIDGITINISECSQLSDAINTIMKNYKEITKKVEDIREQLFPIRGEKAVDIFIDVVKKILNDDIDRGFLVTHRKIVREMNMLQQKSAMQNNIIDKMKTAHDEQLNAVLKIISEYKERISDLSLQLNTYVNADSEKIRKIREISDQLNTYVNIDSEKARKIEEISNQLNSYVNEDFKKSLKIEELANQLNIYIHSDAEKARQIEEISDHLNNYMNIDAEKTRKIEELDNQIYSNNIEFEKIIRLEEQLKLYMEMHEEKACLLEKINSKKLCRLLIKELRNGIK